MNNTNRPEALRLAEVLETHFPGSAAHRAAAELRRLHAEVERIAAIADDLQALCDRQALRIAALEQPQIQSGGIQPNCKQVPLKPTVEMMDAGGAAMRRCYQKLNKDEVMCSYVYRHMLEAAPQPPSGEEQPNWPNLEKAARVGGGTFGIGVSSKLVVDAAQRAHDEHVRSGKLTHEQMVEEERKRRALWDMIHGQVIGGFWRDHGIGGEA